MAKIVVEMTGEQAKLHQAVMAAVADQAKLEKGVDKVAGTSRKAAKAEAALARSAKRVYEETRTPQEQYNARMARLNGLLQRGKIGQDTFNRAVRNAGRDLKSAGAHGHAAFGSQAVQSLTGFAAGLVGVSSAGAGVVQVFREMDKIRKDAAQRARESEFSYGSLAEVSGGDPKKFKRNVATAKRIAVEAGMSENKATRLTFALSSAQAMRETDVFALAYKQGVVQDPETLLRASTAMRKAFGGKKSNRELLNLAFGASEGAPSKASELMAASAGAAAYAKGAGISEQELLAGTAVNATVLDPQGGAKRGGTAMRALAKALARMRSGQTSGDEDPGEIVSEETKATRARLQARLDLSGSTLNMLKQIEAQKFTHAEVQKLFGRQEGLIAYQNILEAEKDYSASLARQSEAEKSGLFMRVLGLPSTDENLRAAKLDRLGKAKKVESDRDLSTEELLYNAAMAHRYSKRGHAGKAYQTLAERTINWLPGRKISELRGAVQGGELEGDPELYASAVQVLGGEKAVFGRDESHVGYGRAGRIATHHRYRKIMGLPMAPGHETETQDVKTWEGAQEFLEVAKELVRALEKNATATDRNTTDTKPNLRPTLAPVNQRD